MSISRNDAYKYAISYVEYCQETGIFTWLRREEITAGGKIFNKRFAGKQCGGDDGRGYIAIGITIKGNLFLLSAHRLAWLFVYGVMPSKHIDHIDGNTKNNSIRNLRDVSRSLNHRNRVMQSNNTSGVTGVCFHKATKVWRARVKVGNKTHYLGEFQDIDEASKVVESFRAKNNFTERHGKAR